MADSGHGPFKASLILGMLLKTKGGQRSDTFNLLRGAAGRDGLLPRTLPAALTA
jgi:hypothetical protein